MDKIKRKINNTIGKIITSLPGDTSQTSTEGAVIPEYDNPVMSALCRRAGAEGAVLLKNKDNALPLKKDEKISVFSRLQIDWFYTGYGSGGDVNPPYCVSLIDGLRNAGACINEELAAKYASFCAENPPNW